MINKITIAIQRKGRLFDSSKDLLIKSGINFSTSGDKLLARSSNMNIDILLVRDDDIPSLVSKGVADLGIVGQNVLAEQVASNKKITAKSVLNLGFSKCRLAFAKPVNSKLRSLKNKIIATSYPGLVKKFLKAKNISAEVIKINGSVELTPYIGIADCICDLVSSGATLEANNLTEFKTLLNSEAVLIASSSYVKIKDKSILAGADSPTIIPLQQENKVAIHALCSEPVFWETMEKLKSNGASSILVMPVEKILN